MTRQFTTWTHAEISKLRAMHARGSTKEQIADALGRPLAGVDSKARSLALYWRKDKSAGWRTSDAELLQQAKRLIPPSTRHGSLTAFIMGDPPPGRSALDQKRGNGSSFSGDMGGRDVA